jgi:uncharacterized membrane protein YGL010W
VTTPMPPAQPMPPAPPGPPPSSGHPVQFSVAHPDRYSRGLAILGVPYFFGRYIALIPVLIELAFLGIAAFFVGWIMQFVVLFTGRYPEGAHRFLTGYLGLSIRTNSWALGLTDRYPGFTIEPDPTGSVGLDVPLAPEYSRGLAVLGCIVFIGRVIALIPVVVVLYVLSIVAGLVAWIMQFVVLFTAKYPAGVHTFVTGYLRLILRTNAWLFGLTDPYPGFSIQP